MECLILSNDYHNNSQKGVMWSLSEATQKPMSEKNSFLADAFVRAAKAVSGVEESLAEIERSNAKSAMHHNCIGFYAPYENCGTTTTLVNVAAVLAARGFTVCAVDLNVDKPDLFRYLKDESRGKGRPDQSIRDKLLNTARPAVEIANPSRLKNVWYISSRLEEHPINYSSNNDGDAQVNQVRSALLTMFAELAVIYDFVLIDIPCKVTDIFSITGLAAADVVYTFHDGTIRTTEQMLKNERVLNGIGFDDIFGNIVQSRIVSDNVRLLAEDFKQVSPKATLIMNIPYVESVAVIGQGAGIFLYQSHEKTMLPTTIRSRFNQLADHIVQSTRTGTSDVVMIASTTRERVSLVQDVSSSVCDFVAASQSPEEAETMAFVASKQTDAENAAIARRIEQRVTTAEEERRREQVRKEQVEVDEAAERARKRAALEALLKEAERKNAEREAKRREEEQLRRIKAAARGVVLEDAPEFELGADLIKTPKIRFENGKLVEVKSAEKEIPERLEFKIPDMEGEEE